jgi:hypothetical protein
VQEVTPYVSAAEMIKKFESGTRELGMPHNRSLSNVSICIHFHVSVVDKFSCPFDTIFLFI